MMLREMVMKSKMAVVQAVGICIDLPAPGVKKIQKDLDTIEKRDTYVETVKLRTEVDQLRSQVSALWDYTNKLRDKFNGH